VGLSSIQSPFFGRMQRGRGWRGKIRPTARCGRGDPLAAVGFIYPVTMVLASLAIGLLADANAAVSQTIGRKETDRDMHRIGLHAEELGRAVTE